jgi:hypothetical protein
MRHAIVSSFSKEAAGEVKKFVDELQSVLAPASRDRAGMTDANEARANRRAAVAAMRQMGASNG